MDRQNFDVVVVGAGFAGMYLLHRLRGMGFRVCVVEAGTGVGGTWYWNRYPGARVDIESMQYSYQFDDDLQQQWEWTEKYSPQPELLKYAEHVADRFDLRRDITFNTRISSAVYDETTSHWSLTSCEGEVFCARFCVMATGCLSSPNWPRIEGLDSFSGTIYHTAEWPHEPVNFHGQRVAIIGTGSSAIQSLPVIAGEASRVTVFQRTPNYSIPAHNAPTDPVRVAAVKANYGAMRARAKQNFPGLDGDYNKVSALDVSAEERESIFEQRWQEGGLMFSGAFGDLLQNSESNFHAAENAWWSHCQEVVTTGLKSTTNSWYLGANVEGKARVFMPYFGGFPAYCAKCEDVVANNYDGFSMI